MDFSKLLNESQLRGVETSSQYVRVIAGAGSGKTRVLTYRIAHLLVNEKVMPYQILAWTFTNKAAKEIKDRVNKLVDYSGHLFLGTIHSWCAMFLRREAEKIDYPRSFTILDDEDQLAIMKELFVKNGRPKSDPNIKHCLNWIGSQKTKGIQYSDIQDREYPNSEMRTFKKYFEEYTEVLKERKSLDFDDLLLKTIEILKRCPEVRSKYCNYIKYILVDEFQDINDVQFDLITLLMDEYTYLYVVGDPDQTIYTWRGANHQIILGLEDSLKAINKNQKLETIILDKNYRSTSTILDCANSLIGHNLERVKKDLFAVNGSGDKVNFFNARTLKEETHHIVSNILDLHKNKGVNYKDIAVLYRSNYLTRELESMLASYRVPYKVFGGMKFYQRKEIKDLIAYFRLIVNDLDDTAFDRIINVPRRGIGPGTMDKIGKASEELGQTKFSYICENINEAPLSIKQKASLTEMISGIKMLREESLNLNPSFVQHLHDFIIDRLGYYDYLKEEDENSYDDRKENVEELFASLQGQLNEDTSLTFEDFVTTAILQSSQDEVSSGDYVSLMTVHTAKGLEYDHVFIYSLGEGIFPSQRAVLESRRGIEEERRLAYVAFTRAKKKLYLSSNQDYSYALQAPLRPSRFIKEAGLQTQNVFNPSSHYQQDTYPTFKQPGLVKKDVAPKPQQSIVANNGITDWKVGDKAKHEKFGVGEVTKVIDKLIVIKFENPDFGSKTFLGNHGLIKRI